MMYSEFSVFKILFFVDALFSALALAAIGLRLASLGQRMQQKRLAKTCAGGRVS